MLVELRLNNFAIIDEISINFGANLNIITGETGTGKSLIVDAINIILGDKFTADHVKSTDKQTSVEAFSRFQATAASGRNLSSWVSGTLKASLS